MGDCVWVTQALDEESVDKALVLGISLRRVLTRKSLVVIVRSSISEELRDSLEATFDFVLSLDEGKCGGLKGMKMTPDALAISYSMSFTFFDRCIYLPPNSLVLKNCDDLFDMEAANGNAEKAGNNTGNGKGSTLKFRPSRDAFKNLMAYMSANKNENGLFYPESGLLKWMQNQPKDTFAFLEEPYSAVIKMQGKHLQENDDNLAIGYLVDLPNNPDKMDPENNGFSSAGILEKFIYGYWLDIYKKQVKRATDKIEPTIDGGCESITLPHDDIQSSNREPIAVVGMSCRYPASNNLSEFWNLLIEGRDGIRTPPDHRWTKEQSIIHNPESRKTQAGFLNVPVDEFDAKFFGISPKEVVFIDPQHRILHELVWEALEDAGINPLELNGTQAGVFMGSWRNDYLDVIKQSSSKEFYRGYMGNSIGAGAARISHLLGLTGPCVSTESGCSAAMVAVHMACRSLQNGESNMAMACGVNLLIHPFTTDVMPMVTAPDGHCKSFDANADGFGRAEGCGVLVLKRLSDAVKDGDSIWGVIKGTAITQEGISKSMGTPTIQCESQAMRDALRDANVHPSKVSYVESHGTGTIVGDPMEVAAIGSVYGEGRQEPLVIGSVKTNVGHTESCSGITGIMKVILSMKNEIIPAHRNFKELNPNVNLEAIPAQLPLEPINWPRVEGKPRTAGISSFGITGTDGHVILQEPLDYSSQRITLKGFERPLHLMTISARTEEALENLLERYKTTLSNGENPDNVLPDLAYTANVGRATFNWRAAVVAKDITDAVGVLDSNKLVKSEIASEDMAGKICFLFTGQGSQYYGMAKELYETSPVFHMHFDRCEEILKRKLKISIAKAFWGKEEECESLVSRTLYSQTGIFVVEYCLMKLWESWGVKPDYVLGHSLGEFCAAVCGGILTFEEALTLVAERSRLIDVLPEGKMLVVKADRPSVDNLLNKFIVETQEPGFWLDYAAVNSADQTVLAGDSEKIVKFSEWLKEKKTKCAVLQSSHAFHSRHMEPMLEQYRYVAESIFRNKPQSELSCKYVSGMLGKIVGVSESPMDWPEYWVQHTREKVNFLNASKAVYNEAGCRLFLEIGPHPVLTAFTMMNNEGKQITCLPSLRRNETDWRTMLGTVSKLFVSGAVNIDWKRFDQFYERKKVGQLLPTYPFQGTKYWPIITNSTGVQIHPLLGSNIPNPTNKKIFQNSLSLQNLEYLKDHVIGSMVVFPGAGYMEALLMAGHVTLDGSTTEFRFPKRPIQIENFRIEAPLGLEEGTGCTCQTVAEFGTCVDGELAGGLHVKIYHEQKDDEESASKWISHASASFSPYNPGNDPNEQVVVEKQKFYQEAIDKLKRSENEQSPTNEFYDKAGDAGLKFGPRFRTMAKGWKEGSGEKQEVLAQVNVPPDVGNYLLHPTLIDAMIQVTVFQESFSEKKLRVPIGCERFVWFRPLTVERTASERKEESEEEKESSENFCYIYSTGNSKTVVLLDKDGHPVAALVKVETIETNAKSIQALLETQVKSIPDLYRVNWKSSMGPCEQRVDFSMITDLVESIDAGSTDRSDYSEITVKMRRDFDILAFKYITRAFVNLGWTPQLHDEIVVDSFQRQLGVKSQHTKLFQHFLTILENEGIFKRINDPGEADRWSVIQLPETVDELLKTSEEKVEALGLIDNCLHQVLLLQAVGTQLDKILSGAESALRILFPEDESKPSVTKFYDSSCRNFGNLVYDYWYKTWASLKRSYEKNSLPLPVIRFLEVGAGTGSVTQFIIDSLEACGVPYEYHFTDISAAFFTAAEKRFEKHRKNIKFLKLNLEEDATSQGFAPKYYDFICGAQVVHATRDIKEAFLNMRQLLKDNGNLFLCEQIGRTRLYDCIFGLLDGFWRFTDHELRPNHASMDIEKWEEAGRATGFNKMAYSHDYELCVIVYRADAGRTSSYDLVSNTFNAGMQQIQKDSRVAWVIFYGEDEHKYVQSLKERFEYLGRKQIILVKHSNVQDPNLESETLLQSKYEIRPNVEEDMSSLFSKLSQHKMKDHPNGFSAIEGILLTWGLIGKGKDQSEVARPYLNLIQSVLKMDKRAIPQIVILTAGQYGVGDAICESPSSSTLLGISKSVSNEHPALKIRGIDINPPEIRCSVDEIFQEIFTRFNEDVHHFCAFRGGERFTPKIFPEKVHTKCLPLPSSTDRFQLIHPKSKAIQDLEFGDLEQFTLKPNEIEVKVKCSALNFKDILNILKPIEEFKDSHGVGFDFAGVVTAVGKEVTQRKVGDPVFGVNLMGNALPSHIKLPEEAVVPVPDSCTFTEAACFPAVFSTAYYCLVNIANCKKGETLLVHAASGGVGLLAIQLAKYFGLKIVCTAGNQRKRAYLRSLGIQHVFHSRNTNFGTDILEATNGAGVDIVLNSLTGPGFKEATLRACAKGARFVEMSKLNIWTEDEVAGRRPDIKYTIIDLTKLDEDTSRQLLAESRQLIEGGTVKPIPYTRFDAQNIRDALTYLQKAQHIGKVVVTMPEVIPGQGERAQLNTLLFSDRSTYLITGGLGGIGLEVCKYLVEQGAKNVVLVGRNPPTDNATDAIDKLKSEKCCNIAVMQADVGDWDQCHEVFRKMKDPANNLPPLRGIMHCAGTLADGLVENLKWEDFLGTYQAKVTGTWNLHQLTKDIILEHFVLFSSATSLFGSPGQASHVSACTFEDTVAHFRNSQGLPATAINWGQFGQVGVAAEKDIMGIRPFSAQQGINALDFILRQNRNHLMVVYFENTLAAAVKYLQYTKHVMDKQVFKNCSGSSVTKAFKLNSDQFWEEYNDCKDDRDAKLEVVKNNTKTLLRHVLRLDSDEPIDENAELQDLGVDSLMMLELKNSLQEVLGDRVQITQSAMKDCTTVNLLSDRLVQLIEAEGEFSNVEPPTLEDIGSMVVEDTKLPEKIQAQVPDSEKKPSEIKTVLMTGATGTLGSHMLREILQEYPKLEKMYCLIRTRCGEAPEERLHAILERKCILGSMNNFEKVQCISGNFIEERLGLSEADYCSLANEVDAVVHCGAKVNHLEYYRNVPGGRSDTRSVNVGGLHKILEFAGMTRTKHVFNMSTLVTAHEVDDDDTLREGWPIDLSPPYNRGYPVSKYVCDFLLKEANERGIPCKSFKFAELRGSTVARGSLMESSHIMKTYLFFMKEGIMPETPFPSNFLPVDLASRLSVRIMFSDETPNDVYNISHPQPQLAQEYFPKLAEEFGHPVTLVSWEEYRSRTVESLEDANNKDRAGLLTEFKDLYKDDDGFASLFTNPGRGVTKFLENGDNFFKSKKLAKFAPDLYHQLESSYEIHRRDLLVAKSEGILEKLGL